MILTYIYIYPRCIVLNFQYNLFFISSILISIYTLLYTLRSCAFNSRHMLTMSLDPWCISSNELRMHCSSIHVFIMKFRGEYCESFWCLELEDGHVDAHTANFNSVETSLYYMPFIL